MRISKKQVDVLFRVPNTEEGRAFLAQAKKFLNKKTYSLIKRTRGSKRREARLSIGYSPSHAMDMPVSIAEWYGIYANRKDRKFYRGYND